jgi:hypothetical protein
MHSKEFVRPLSTIIHNAHLTRSACPTRGAVTGGYRKNDLAAMRLRSRAVFSRATVTIVYLLSDSTPWAHGVT